MAGCTAAPTRGARRDLPPARATARGESDHRRGKPAAFLHGPGGEPPRARADLPYGDQRRLGSHGHGYPPNAALLDEPAAGLNEQETLEVAG